LADLAEAPINEITAAIAKRAEMNGQLSTAFIALVNDALRTGAVLLLVDGLDEISDERVRLSFARQLRIFSSMYPKISMVVTSREAGFRAAAGALSSCCIPYTIAELDDIDIKNLTLAWHKEVVGDRAEVAAEAAGLAEAICNTSRVNELAKNPLLLTTLLLVKRWVGQLPTRRSVLYGKAIEVLLMTWNVEGHEPLDQEEVIPQLAYVAHTMMSEGIQRITSRRLQELLTAARQQMPEVLSFAKLSVTEFVDRVESRSSLLIQSGHDVENGTLLPVYEFRHLTFQEYLTALSMVEGYCPSSSEHDNVVAILEPHLADERWKEVIPLAAVLLGRRVHPLISWLVNRAIMSPESLGISADIHPAIVLAECVADECALAPDLLAQALEIIARRSVVCASILPRLIISKYGELFGDLVLRVYKSATTDLFSLANAVQNVSPEARRISSLRLSTRLGEIKSLLDGKGENMALGAIILAYTAYDCAIGRVEPTDDEKVLLEKLGNSATVLLFSAEIPLQFCAMWAITWLANSKLWSPLAEPAVLKRLTELWMQREATDVRHVAAWALSRLPLLSRSAQPMGVDTQTMISFVKTIKPENKTIWDRHDFTASCIVAYYLGAPWPEKLLKERFKEAYGFIPDAQPLWVGAWGAP
jgi:hypothetical protein